MRILLAEDDRDVRQAYIWMLEELGHEVVAVEDGEKAWDLLSSEHDFDLLISDTSMPVMTGVELLKRARGALPALLMSALPDLDGLDLARFTRENRARFIQKGAVSLDDLEHVINEAIDLFKT